MNSKKLPAFQLYPGDWRKDPGVQALDYEYRGIWFEILLLMHESDQRGKLLLNGKPMPEDALARLLGLDKQKLTKAITTLLEYGVAGIDSETGAIINRRMVRDEEIRKTRQECGKRGGNPNLVNQNTTKNKKEVNQSDNQNSTPSSSTSISSSISSSNSKKHINYVGFVEFWNKINGCSLRITDAKRSQIKARLETFNEEELKRSIINRSKNEWINRDGQKFKTDWNSFWRNDEKVERYLNENVTPNEQKYHYAPQK